MLKIFSHKKKLEKEAMEMEERAKREAAFEAQKKRASAPSACVQPPYAFQTKSGGLFIVNPGKRLIWGGPIMIPQKYDKIIVKKGAPAQIFLSDEYVRCEKKERYINMTYMEPVLKKAPSIVTMEVAAICPVVTKKIYGIYMKQMMALGREDDGFVDVYVKERMKVTKARLLKKKEEKEKEKD